MRWVQPGAQLFGVKGLVRSVTAPEFAGMTFHEVLAKSALNKVPTSSSMPFSWTINPYRGCSHACVYCFARNTHRYLDLDPGADFDRQVIVKINTPEVLAAEVAKPKWTHELVALGTNTDPYQRAEGRYGLMPGIITALAEHDTPMSILTKGTLLRRDLPLLARAAEDVPVELGMSIAVHDDELQQSIEPGTPTTTARLATVKAAADLGFDVSVFLMPVMPKLTDSIDHLDQALKAIRDAGATRVVYGALHLRPGAREWFFAWLEREHPDLLPRYRRMYANSSYASKEYRKWLAERINPLIDRYSLRGADEEDPSPRDTSALGSTAGPGSVSGSGRTISWQRFRARREQMRVSGNESLGASLAPPAQQALF
ncbi:Rv2578c family radical SAM protein [Brevibacterium sp.]|uniref:Rv2578c family radical SAM protein n=1 Tax=Brevibacterium sp. TaxID=1701 RepID=UPI0028109FDD|nr:Rv2578c family radical SAM protein [Brevibacterium sp.]